MAYERVRRVFEAHRTPGSVQPRALPPCKSPENVREEPLTDIRFLFPVNYDEELALYVSRDLQRSKLDRTLRQFKFRGVSSETTRTQVAPMGALPVVEPHRRALAAERSSGPQSTADQLAASDAAESQDKVQDWIEQRKAHTASIEEMGLSEQWFAGKVLDPLEKRVCTKLYGRVQTAQPDWPGGLVRSVSALALDESHAGSLAQSQSYADDGRPIGSVLDEFIRNNRWNLYRVFMKRCGLESHYLMPIADVCKLLEEAGRIVRSADFEVQHIPWHGSLTAVTSSQLRRHVAQAVVPDRLGMIDYRRLLEDHKTKADVKRRMLRDTYRRRMLAMGERTDKDLHVTIATSVAKGDPLRWISETEHEHEHRRRSVHRRESIATPSRSLHTQSRLSSASSQQAGSNHGSNTRLATRRPSAVTTAGSRRPSAGAALLVQRSAAGAPVLIE
eukprot:m.61637 g.61637  ORF g.61637 m.61637 type:complete len:446 (+) comp7099_c0_seq1:62-1399(+)